MKDELFEKVRSEEVVLWAGAGLSMYAGFPSGKELSELILDKMTESTRHQINKNSSLLEMTEDFTRIHGGNRNQLIRILKEIFNRKPTSRKVHDTIKTIPHFKNIITTNYDTLFEDAYQADGQRIIQDNQIPYIEKNKTQIFKAHGDLSLPDSIVITKSDYDNFFAQGAEDRVIWSVIKERISANSILFMGYSLEDSNVSVVFEKITTLLQSNKRESFLVAPNLPNHKVNHLLSKGIHYINDTAENVINELLINIKDNIINDLEKGRTSSDTFRKFLNYHNLLPELGTKNDSYHLKSIRGNEGVVEGQLDMTLKNDSSFIEELNKYLNGDIVGDFVISEDFLINANLRYGGVKIHDSDGIKKLEIKSLPKLTTEIDIVFDKDFELNGIPVKVFATHTFVEFHLELTTALIIVKMTTTELPKTEFNIQYTHKELCSKISEEIDFFTLLNLLGKGEKFKVFSKSQPYLSEDLPALVNFIEESEFYLDYFQILKLIEIHFNIRFQNFPISSISDSSYILIQKLKKYINNEKIEHKWDGECKMEFTNPEKVEENIKWFENSSQTFEITNEEEDVVQLHGIDIKLGYMKYEILEPYIENMDQILSRKESLALIKSKCSKVNISYVPKNKNDNTSN